MGQWSDQFMVYVCDNCGTEVTIDGVIGGPLGGPANWKSITPSATRDGDWFCSYTCLSAWAADMQVKLDARAEARAATAREAE